MIGILKQDGFEFAFNPRACASCEGNCCRGRSGNIWVSAQELYQISGFLGISTIDFIQKYLRPTNNRYSLQEIPVTDGFDCIFFDTNEMKCSIYAVRPWQCRQFPFWDIYRDHLQQLIDECPGVRIIINK